METAIQDGPKPYKSTIVRSKTWTVLGWVLPLLVAAILSSVLFMAFLLGQDEFEDSFDALYYRFTFWSEVEERLEHLPAWRREGPVRVRSFPRGDGKIVYLAEIPASMGWAYCEGPGFSPLLTLPKEKPRSMNGQACFWLDGSDKNHRILLSNQMIAAYSLEHEND